MTCTWATGGKKDGKKVFDDERKAVKDLARLNGVPSNDDDDGHDHDDDDDKGAKDTVSDVALQAAIRVIADLVAADRKLAQTVLDESKAAITLDPKNQKEVDKKHKDSQKELDRGDADLAKGKPDKAIEHYRKAWEKSQDAIAEQDKEPKKDKKGKDDDDGKGKK